MRASRTTLLAALCGLAGLFACSQKANDAQPGPVPPPARWNVARGFVRDPQGRATILRGVNLAGSHKNAPYFSFHQPADFARLSGPWGMNAIRLLVEWAAIEPEEGKYDDAYLDKVADRVQWATDAGLLVIVDMHQDLYGEGFNGGNGAPKWTCDESHYASYKPRTPWFLGYSDEHMLACYDHFWHTPSLLDHYVEAWKRLATRLRGYPSVVGLDPMNEPFYGTTKISSFENDVLLPLYVRVVEGVRTIAPQWLAFMEPSSSRNLGFPTWLEKIPFGDVVYSPHSYDSAAESGDPFGTSGHDGLVATISVYADEAKVMGAAVWFGEYGGTSTNPGIRSYMDAEYVGAGKIAAGQMYWAYDRGDAGYAMLRADGSEKPEILDVVVRPFPDRVAGDPIDWTFDEPTSTFTFRYAPDSTLKAKTEISVPSRRYPDGYRVECGGCTFEKTTTRLRILSTTATPTVVTVRP